MYSKNDNIYDDFELVIPHLHPRESWRRLEDAFKEINEGACAVLKRSEEVTGPKILPEIGIGGGSAAGDGRGANQDDDQEFNKTQDFNPDDSYSSGVCSTSE
jgi:hypothetical protein